MFEIAVKERRSSRFTQGGFAMQESLPWNRIVNIADIILDKDMLAGSGREETMNKQDIRHDGRPR
jgi:hypothetical protein